MKRIIWFLLIILGLIVAVGGCVRWPNGPNGNGGTENYQLEITVEVKGEINTDEGMYYIVLDADGNPIDGPGDDVEFWDDDFYYVKLDGMGFYFAQVEEGSPELQLTDSSYSGNKIQIIIALSDLEDPSSVDINVLTTDSNNNTYDSLDNGYFTINTNLGSKPLIDDQENDSGEGGVDFDIFKVTTNITTF